MSGYVGALDRGGVPRPGQWFDEQPAAAPPADQREVWETVVDAHDVTVADAGEPHADPSCSGSGRWRALTLASSSPTASAMQRSPTRMNESSSIAARAASAVWPCSAASTRSSQSTS